jgi:hypothetical protein
MRLSLGTIPDAVMTVALPSTPHRSDDRQIGSISILPMPYDPPILSGALVKLPELMVVRALLRFLPILEIYHWP